MNYTFHQLQVFLKVIEFKSVTKASEALFMTQPAVSIQLKKLQEQFELPLTEVINRRIHITEFGYEIAEVAKRILADVEDMRYLTDAYKGLLSGKLNIAAASTGKYIIPYFLTDFLRQHPGIHLNLDVSNRQRVIDQLMSNKVDFALVSKEIDDPSTIQEELIIENKLHLYSAPALEFCEDKIDFTRNPLILREEGSATRKFSEQFLEERGIKPSKTLSLTSNEAVKQAVMAGLGYALMSDLSVTLEIKNNLLKTIPFKGLPIKSHWRLVWLKEKRLSLVAKGFLSHIQTQKNEIVKQYF